MVVAILCSTTSGPSLRNGVWVSYALPEDVLCYLGRMPYPGCFFPICCRRDAMGSPAFFAGGRTVSSRRVIGQAMWEEVVNILLLCRFAGYKARTELHIGEDVNDPKYSLTSNGERKYLLYH